MNPPAYFNFFGLQVYIYGAVIGLGFVLAMIYCLKRSQEFGISEDHFLNAVLLSAPIGIIGARLYFVIFNFSPEFSENPIRIITGFRDGGLAIYGGIIMGTVGALISSKIWKFSFRKIMDLVSYGFLIGQTAGRWGNFFNREAFGSQTDIFCRMGLTLPGYETYYVHPTFLYESLWNLIGFILLHIYSKKKPNRYDGQIFVMYIGWYGFGRMLIEGLRTDSLYLFGSSIRVSQLLAGLSFLAAAAILIICRNKAKIPAEPAAADRDEDNITYDEN